MTLNIVTTFLALLAVGLVGFEIGKYVMQKKIEEAFQHMAETMTEVTKKIQATKGGNIE